MYRSLTIAALLGGIIGGSLWSIVDDARRPAPVAVKGPAPEAKPERTASSKNDGEMRDCVEALNAGMDKRDALRNSLIGMRAQLAAAQLPADSPAAQAVTWRDEADAPEAYLKGIMEALQESQGRVLLSACDEFPCVFGVELPEAALDGVVAALQPSSGEPWFTKRIGIDDDGGVIHYFALGRANAPELSVGEEAVVLRFETRSLLLDNAYRDEVTR